MSGRSIAAFLWGASGWAAGGYWLRRYLTREGRDDG
jgi:hypothetical protein